MIWVFRNRRWNWAFYRYVDPFYPFGLDFGPIGIRIQIKKPHLLEMTDTERRASTLRAYTIVLNEIKRLSPEAAEEAGLTALAAKLKAQLDE